MSYPTKQALLDDIAKFAVAVGETKLISTAGNIETYRVEFHAEIGEFQMLGYSQPFYVNNLTGEAWLAGQLANPTIEFLNLKTELAKPAYSGLSAANAVAALNGATVPVPNPQPISLRSLQVAVGVSKWAQINQVLQGVITAGQQPGATEQAKLTGLVVSEILDALDPTASRLTVDPTTDEYQAQVMAMQSIVNAAAGSTLFTAADAQAMQALGKASWAKAHGVVVRERIVQNIIG